jgi:thioredoxin-related protein
MKVKTFLIIFSALLAGTYACSHEAVKSDRNSIPEVTYAWKVNWHSLDQGIKKARDEKKPMLIDFAVHEGCHRCEFMQKNVYSNDLIVEKIHKDFIPIFIDLAETLAPDELALGEKHKYHEDCLLLFLDHNKEPIFDDKGGKMCFVDQIEPEVFIDYLDYIITIYNQKSIS